ncbi:MAG TPA: sigma-70 family RNA polymerase sigma factor [Candidatus Limnocylindria bacterium]|nr:sigma-70 family RNA polymerase sigma factor [Candidatus Limnocylindria bacterium]
MTMGIDAMQSAQPAAQRRDADRLAVVDLQERRGPELFGFARRLGLSRDEADDAVQEALLRVWLALDSGTPIKHLDAWSFRTLYRICMDQHRWRRRARLLTERIRPSNEVRDLTAARLAVWEAVDQLPERQRAVVYLRYRADLTFEQIGDVLGIAAVSARSHASRAIDRLGSLLSREDFR